MSVKTTKTINRCVAMNDSSKRWVHVEPKENFGLVEIGMSDQSVFMSVSLLPRDAIKYAKAIIAIAEQVKGQS